MAEGLAALGTAASIAQFVTMGLKGAAYAWRVYSSAEGLVIEQDEMQSIARDVHAACQSIQQRASGQATSASLQPLLDASVAISRKLDQKLDKLRRRSASGRLEKYRQLYRAARRKRGIEELQSRLLKLRDEVSFHLLELSQDCHAELVAGARDLTSTLQDNHSQTVLRLKALHDKLTKLELTSQQKELSEVQVNQSLNALAKDIELVVANRVEWQLVESLLKSLHFPQISERRSEVKAAHAHTFEWPLSDDKTSLARWLRSGDGIYWIEGKAGCGKSTLMKYLNRKDLARELLQEWADQRLLLVASHFFWGPGTELQRGLTGLFRTLLFQIFMEHPEIARHVCPERTNPKSFKRLESWSLEDLHSCFYKLANLPNLPGRFCFFIDGLDEFNGDLSDLIAILHSISASTDIKLCVSSRPWREFRDAFGAIAWQLRVHDFTSGDISKYVQDMLTGNERFEHMRNSSPQTALSFIAEIVERADGVFLWVYLVVRNLLRGFSNHDDISTLTRRLREFPQDLEDYFERMLDTIDPVYHQESDLIFSMLSYTRTSLPLELVWDNLPMWTAKIRSLVRHWSLPLDGFYFPNPDFWAQVCNLADEVGQFIEAMHLSSEARNNLKAESSARHIASVCRDLVYTWHGDGPHPSYKVGFLHRSVADFFALPRISNKLKGRAAKLDGFSSPCFILATAHMRLFRQLLVYEWHAEYTSSQSALRSLTEVSQIHFLWSLYHIAMLSIEQPDDSRPLADLLVVLSCRYCHSMGVFMKEYARTESGASLELDEEVGSHMAQMLSERLRIEGRPCREKFSSLEALIGRVTNAWEPLKGAVRFGDDVVTCPGMASLTDLRRRVKEGHDILVPGLVFRALLHDALRPRIMIELSDEGPRLTTARTIDLARVKELLRTNEHGSEEILRTNLSSISAWSRFLVEMDENLRQNSWTVTNFFETCQLLMMYGASRYIDFNQEQSRYVQEGCEVCQRIIGNRDIPSSSKWRSSGRDISFKAGTPSGYYCFRVDTALVLQAMLAERDESRAIREEDFQNQVQHELEGYEHEFDRCDDGAPAQTWLQTALSSPWAQLSGFWTGAKAR